MTASTATPAAGAAAPAHREGLTAAQWLAFATVYLLLALVGRSTLLWGASTSLLWPAAGVAVLWLLAESPTRQVRVLAVIAVEVAVVLAATGETGALVVAGPLAVAVQTWLVVLLLRRCCPDLIGAGGDESVHTPRVLLRGTLIVLVSCLAGATIASGGRWVGGDELTVWDPVLTFGRQVAGMIAVGSVGHLGWEWWTGRARDRVRGGGGAELAAMWGVSVAMMVAVFLQPLPLVFLLVPLSVWCAARFITFVGALHATAMGVLALLFTLAGRGPFIELGGPEVEAMVTQVFLLTLLLTSLAVGTMSDRVDALLSREIAAQQEAAEQTELLSLMTESMGEGLVVLDGSGRVAQHNAASTGLARRFRPGPETESLTALVMAVLSAPPATQRRPELGPGDVAIPLHDGGEMILAVTSRPMTARSGDDGSGTLWVLREVTAHRGGLRPLVDFAETTAHDLRGPLTTMRTWLSLITEYPEVTEVEKLRTPLDRVERAVVQMGDVIDDLLAHATTQGGELAPERVELSGPDGLLADVVELVGVADAVHVAADLPAVFVDPGGVRQLFANIIGNGIKFTRPGESPRVEITGTRRGDRAVFEVRDHGVGVPDEDRERIFERFRRSGAVKSTYAGTGLGLSLCRTVVERHGGRIECRAPAAGQGTLFRFDLPVADVVAPIHQPGPTASTRTPGLVG